MDDETKEASERPEFYSYEVSLMNVIPGNFDHAEGEEAVVVTLGKRDMSIESQVYSLRDARSLVAQVLVALASMNDRFAGALLDNHFSADADGNFVWPKVDDPT